MCGIFGVLSESGIRGDLARIVRANDIAAHRGPDGAGVVWFDTRREHHDGIELSAAAPYLPTEQLSPTLAFGHRRLAIIDLSDLAAQPMANDDRSVWITYNGELYNYVELRKTLAAEGVRFRTRSDTEVVLRAYEQWGEAAMGRFVGMWAFAVVDLRRRRIVLSRDRFGIKPLHYYAGHSIVVFGSEIKQLLALEEVPRRINERAVYEYLRYEAVDTGPETFFTGICKVRPGHNLVLPLGGGARHEARYYQLPAGPGMAAGPDARYEFRALLKDSVRAHLCSDVPVGTCLSGGLDSSSIAMLMRELALEAGRGGERHAFNAHFDEPEANELEFTRLAVDAADVTTHFVRPRASDLITDLRQLIWHQDEPFGSTSIYAQWSVFRLVRTTGVKVVLDGQGADEMLAGYASLVPYYLLELVAKRKLWRALWESWRWSRHQGIPWFQVVPLPRLRRALDILRRGRGGGGTSVGEPSWLNPEFEADHTKVAQYVHNHAEQPFGGSEHLGNALYQFFFLNNLPALLRYEDRNSMAFSVEARVPFLDHRLVEFAFSLPSPLKIRDGFSKRVLRDAMAGTLPDRLCWRARKMGFATPERAWQEGPLRPLIEQALESGRLDRYVNIPAARRHYARATDAGALSFAPWRWLNLSMWMEVFDLG